MQNVGRSLFLPQVVGLGNVAGVDTLQHVNLVNVGNRGLQRPYAV